MFYHGESKPLERSYKVITKQTFSSRLFTLIARGQCRPPVGFVLSGVWSEENTAPPSKAPRRESTEDSEFHDVLSVTTGRQFVAPRIDTGYIFMSICPLRKAELITGLKIKRMGVFCVCVMLAGLEAKDA